MIVSFKDYLNESQDENNIDNDDWTQILPKETKETKEDKKGFSTDDILKSKKYKLCNSMEQISKGTFQRM